MYTTFVFNLITVCVISVNKKICLSKICFYVLRKISQCPMGIRAVFPVDIDIVIGYEIDKRTIMARTCKMCIYFIEFLA